MQASFCNNCGEPLAPGAAFCPRCGTKVAAPHVDHAATQLQPPPPPPPATLRASAPPVDNYPPSYPSSQGAPTQRADPPLTDQYASQYPSSAPGAYSQYSAPSGPSTPSYTPGPPPVVTPGGVAPWAQPQKGQGGRNFLKLALILILLLAALGGGLYFLLHKSSTANKGGPAATPTTGSATGATSTPGSGSTVVTTGGTQMLNNINRVGVYGGVTVTVLSAIQTKSVPDDFKNFMPDQDDILKIAVMVDSPVSRHGGFFFTHRLLGPDGRLMDVGLGHGLPKDGIPEIFGDPLTIPAGAFYFEVPKASKITDWTLVIGDPSEVLLEIPLGGNYDPTVYQEKTHTMGLNQPVTFDKGAITGVITKIITVVWNPCGCQAPKGMRFLRVYFHVTNNTAGFVFVGDGNYSQYLLIYPNGDSLTADTRYNAAINAQVNGQESKDVGFDSWVIPATPAAYKMVFKNPDGSVVGTIDFGTV